MNTFYKLSAAVLMAVLMAASAGAEAMDTAATGAQLTLAEGAIMLDVGPTGTAMDLNFGEQPLPIRAVTYPAVSGSTHRLAISEARAGRSGWTVTARMSDFVTADSIAPDAQRSFAAMVELVDGALIAASPAGVSVSPRITLISSDAATQTILRADGSQQMGAYTAVWTPENVRMTIPSAQLSRIGVYAYGATIQWMLVLDT